MRGKYSQRHLEGSGAERGSSTLNIASRQSLIMREKWKRKGKRGGRLREFKQRKPRKRGQRKEDKREHAWLKCHGYTGMKGWERDSHGLEKLGIEGQDEKN